MSASKSVPMGVGFSPDDPIFGGPDDPDVRRYHTAECLARWRPYEERRRAWAAAHPNHCPHCEGWGGFASCYDPSPAGVGLSPGCMPDWDPCPKCLERGVCPRCGQETLVPDDEPEACTSCGWSMSDPDGMPPPYECGCAYMGVVRS